MRCSKSLRTRSNGLVPMGQTDQSGQKVHSGHNKDHSDPTDHSDQKGLCNHLRTPCSILRCPCCPCFPCCRNHRTLRSRSNRRVRTDRTVQTGQLVQTDQRVQMDPLCRRTWNSCCLCCPWSRPSPCSTWSRSYRRRIRSSQGSSRSSSARLGGDRSPFLLCLSPCCRTDRKGTMVPTVPTDPSIRIPTRSSHGAQGLA